MQKSKKKEEESTKAALKLIINKLTKNLGESEQDNIKQLGNKLSSEDREKCWKLVGIIADTVFDQSEDEELKKLVIFHCLKLLWFLTGSTE